MLDRCEMLRIYKMPLKTKLLSLIKAFHEEDNYYALYLRDAILKNLYEDHKDTFKVYLSQDKYLHTLAYEELNIGRLEVGRYKEVEYFNHDSEIKKDVYNILFIKEDKVKASIEVRDSKKSQDIITKVLPYIMSKGKDKSNIPLLLDSFKDFARYCIEGENEN